MKTFSLIILVFMSVLLSSSQDGEECKDFYEEHLIPYSIDAIIHHKADKGKYYTLELEPYKSEQQTFKLLKDNEWHDFFPDSTFKELKLVKNSKSLKIFSYVKIGDRLTHVGGKNGFSVIRNQKDKSLAVRAFPDLCD